MDTDRNLLFAVLALQTDFLTRDQFVDACALWAGRKDRPIAELLVEQNWLSRNDRSAVEALLARKLGSHGGDARAALSLLTTDAIRATLGDVGDSEVAAVVAAATPPPVGHVLVSAVSAPSGESRYTLTHLHAVGGIGQVWLARDDNLGREVALKELKPERASNPAVWARFLREARVTGQLEHPGIVPVYELGSKANTNQPFYTMRFVRGRTLTEAARQYHRRRAEESAGPLEFRDLLASFGSACQAIAYAHSRGVLHRDLKPQNVVLGDFGEVMVLDWGLARLTARPDDPTDPTSPTMAEPLGEATSNDTQVTLQGQVLGTPAYMAPEQATGDLARLGPATDVYGLGATLYELLAARPPYTGSSTDDVLRQVRESEPPSPRVAAAWVPLALDAVCRKAMAKNTAERYQSASALADDVRRFLADEPVSAFRESLADRVGRWARRHRPLVAGATAAGLVLILALAGLAAQMALRDQDARLTERSIRQQVERKMEEARFAVEDGNPDRAIAHLSEGSGLCRQHLDTMMDTQSEIAGQLGRLAQYKSFRTRSAAILREGVHGIRDGRGPDPLFPRCEEALAIYGVTASDDWHRELASPPLSLRQAEEVKQAARELLVLAAIRLALFDTRDEAAKAATRRALGLLDRAAALAEPSPSELTLRMFWHRRLGDNAAADQAGEAMTAKVKAAGGLQTARDHYLFGSITLNVLKKPKEALAAYQQALKREPNHYGALFGLFLCCSELKDEQGQLAALTACLAMRPDQPDLYYFRGMAHFALKQYDAAFHDFDASVQRDPKYKTGYFYRGRMRVVSDKWSEAEKDFTKAIDLDPEFTQAVSWRAIARAKTGRHREAAADAELAAKREPKERSTLFSSARAYAQAVKAATEDKMAPDREALAKRYGDRCVELLRQALANGFTDTGRLAPGGDFDPIRERADFQELIKRFPAAAPGP